MDGRGFEMSGVAIVQTCSQLLKLYQTYWTAVRHNNLLVYHRPAIDKHSSAVLYPSR